MHPLLAIYRQEPEMTARRKIETSDKVEEFMERARSRYARIKPEKKKRFPRFLVVVNIMVIILVLYLYITSDPMKTYFTASMNVGGVNYDASLSRESGTATYLFKVILRSQKDEAVAVPFDGTGVACLKLYYGNMEIMERCAGRDVREVSLMKKMKRTYAAFLQRSGITEMLREKAGEQPFRDHKKYFNPGKTLIPLRAVVTINTGGGVSSEHTFKYEAD
jgi:hypothetical protein